MINSILIPSDNDSPIEARQFEGFEAIIAYFSDEGTIPCVETVVGLGNEMHASAILDETPFDDGHNQEINSRANVYMNKGFGDYLGDMILVGGSMLVSDGPEDVPFTVEDVNARLAANAKDPGALAEASAEEEEAEAEAADTELEAELEDEGVGIGIDD